MNIPKIRLADPGWRTGRLIAASGETLRVHYPIHRKELLESAVVYWQGALEGLELVRQQKYDTGVIQCGRLGASGPVCYFKYLKLRDLGDWVKLWFRSSRALRILRNELALQACGFHVAPPVLVIERRFRGVYGRSALISERVEAYSLAEWLTCFESSQRPSTPSKNDLIDAVAQAVGALHRSGFYHGEMSLNNVLVRLRDGRFEIIWIDNERTRQYRRLPFRRRIQNLNQLNRDQQLLSRRNRLRFLVGYAGQAGLSKSERRLILERVRRHSRRKGRAL